MRKTAATRISSKSQQWAFEPIWIGRKRGKQPYQRETHPHYAEDGTRKNVSYRIPIWHPAGKVKTCRKCNPT